MGRPHGGNAHSYLSFWETGSYNRWSDTPGPEDPALEYESR